MSQQPSSSRSSTSRSSSSPIGQSGMVRSPYMLRPRPPKPRDPDPTLKSISSSNLSQKDSRGRRRRKIVKSFKSKPSSYQLPKLMNTRRLHERILSRFACPSMFDCPSSHAESSNSTNVVVCKFGHNPRKGLKQSFNPLPDYCCVRSLTDSCTNESFPMVNVSEKTGVLPIITRCYAGVHLDTVQHLSNLELFEHRYRSTIDHWISSCDERQCGICLESVLAQSSSAKRRPFGMLESCQHPFCAQCITRWYQSSKHCPTCRQPSSRLLFTYHFVDSVLDKKRLFLER